MQFCSNADETYFNTLIQEGVVHPAALEDLRGVRATMTVGEVIVRVAPRISESNYLQWQVQQGAVRIGPLAPDVEWWRMRKWTIPQMEELLSQWILPTHSDATGRILVLKAMVTSPTPTFLGATVPVAFTPAELGAHHQQLDRLTRSWGAMS